MYRCIYVYSFVLTNWHDWRFFPSKQPLIIIFYDFENMASRMKYENHCEFSCCLLAMRYSNLSFCIYFFLTLFWTRILVRASPRKLRWMGKMFLQITYKDVILVEFRQVVLNNKRLLLSLWNLRVIMIKKILRSSFLFTVFYNSTNAIFKCNRRHLKEQRDMINRHF